MTPRKLVAWTVEALGSLTLALAAGRDLLSFRRLEDAFELEDGPIPRKLAR